LALDVQEKQMAEDLAADEIRAPLKLEHHATLPQQSECSR
jgi:hypothetical protein